MIDFTVAAWSAINSRIKNDETREEEILCRPKIIELVFELPDDIYERMGLKILRPHEQFSIEWVSLINKKLKTWLPLKVILSDDDYIAKMYKDGKTTIRRSDNLFTLGNVLFRGRYDFRLTKYNPNLFTDDGKEVIEVPDDYSPPFKLDIQSLRSNSTVIDRIRREYRRVSRFGSTDEYLFLDENNGYILETEQQIEPGCIFILLTRIYRNYLWLGWNRKTAILQYTEKEVNDEYEKYTNQEYEFRDYLVDYLKIENKGIIDIVNEETKRAKENKLFIFDGEED